MPPATEPGEEVITGTPEVAPPATSEPNLDAGSRPDTPDSSTGTDDSDADAPKSMAEAIERALDEPAESDDPEAAPPPKAPAEAQPETPPDETPKEPEVPEGEPDPTEEELKAYKPKARRDMVRLLSQRNTARRELADVTSKWDADKTDANSYREVTAFMQAARLEAAEVRELFDVGRKLKSNDPRQLAEALDTLMPLTLGLLELTGRAIPADLKGKVEDGEVTEELARQMATDRANARIAAQLATQAVVDRQSQQQQLAFAQYTTGIQTAVNAWELKTKASDPDWKLKAASLADAARSVLAQRGPPPTPAHAVAYAQEAYARVNETFKALRPALVPTRPAPGNSGQSGNRTAMTPEPRTLEEAIFGAIRASAH